jgi:hypothetical protein
MKDLTAVSEDEFDKYIAFHNSHRPLRFERTSGGIFYWYGISLMAAKWEDKTDFFVSTSDYEMYQQGKSLYQRRNY